MDELTKYEHARIIGARALQISMGAPIKAKLSEEDLKKIGYNTIDIAKMEYQQGLIEIAAKRPLPYSKRETVSKAFDQTKLE